MTIKTKIFIIIKSFERVSPVLLNLNHLFPLYFLTTLWDQVGHVCMEPDNAAI